jgi:ATP-dependent Lon protease
VIVEPTTIKAHPKLLVGGVWCICEIEYFHGDDARVLPWILGSIKPIQLSNFDFDGYLAARQQFATDEWIDLLVQSIGFNPELFGRRAKLIQLVRLIPFVERNYNLVELGPKGTGKSHIFSEFSPHGMLISGGEVTVPKLFVNNSNGRLGFVGNTTHTVPYMLKHSDLFDELPESYHDSAFLDRLHHYIPGWEVDTIRGEMFSDGYGYVVDYIAEVLKSMRSADYSDRYQLHFTLSPDISTRDRDGIHKTFSGLMKILYPHGEATVEEIEEILRFAIEGRKRVKEQILRIDATMADVKFGYSDTSGSWHAVATLEEDEYPAYYPKRAMAGGEDAGTSVQSGQPAPDGESIASPVTEPATLFEGHREFQENQRGVSYEELLLPYLQGGSQITITDPYIRLFHQARNLMELIGVLAKSKDAADEIKVSLVTSPNDESLEKREKQVEFLASIEQGAAAAGITFEYHFDPAIHDRSITTDTGWRIVLGRGLDIFQYFPNDAFDLSSRVQAFRQVKAFGATYVRGDPD